MLKRLFKDCGAPPDTFKYASKQLLEYYVHEILPLLAVPPPNTFADSLKNYRSDTLRHATPSVAST